MVDEPAGSSGEQNTTSTSGEPQTPLRIPEVRGGTDPEGSTEVNQAEANANKPKQKAYAAFEARVASAWLRLNDNHGSWTALATIMMAATMIVYTLYAGGMWYEMRRSGAYSRLAQRAWVSFSFGVNIPLEDGKLFIQPITFTNTGKTPAKRVAGRFVTMLAGQSDLPSFSYTHGMQFPAGIMFPGNPNPVGSILMSYPNEGMPQPIVMTESIRRALGAGQIFIVTYGNITYEDVFGDPHWLHFCTVGPQAVVPLYAGWKTCYQYNDDDTKVP